MAASSYKLPCNGQVTLDGSASSDPDAGDSIVAYSWDVYDKANTLLTTGSGSMLSVSYAALPAGATYYVSLSCFLMVLTLPDNSALRLVVALVSTDPVPYLCVSHAYLQLSCTVTDGWHACTTVMVSVFSYPTVTNCLICAA